jgi:hypothetical protein
MTADLMQGRFAVLIDLSRVTIDNVEYRSHFPRLDLSAGVRVTPCSGQCLTVSKCVITVSHDGPLGQGCITHPHE